MRNAFILTVVLLLTIISAAFAAVPPMISYQGKLMQPSGAPVPDGIYSIQFAIYGAPTGGTALWSECNSNVQVKAGLYAVLLGSINNLGPNILDSQNRFLGITVGSDSELTPRQRIASVATALRANEADIAKTVPDGAVTTNKVADSSITSDKLADSAISASKIVDGAVTRQKIASGAVTSDQVAAGLVSSKLDFSSMFFLDGTSRESPRIASGMFNRPTIAGANVFHTLNYGIAFTAGPRVIVIPGPGYDNTAPCHVSVQRAQATTADLTIADTWSNSYREFYWIAIGY